MTRTYNHATQCRYPAIYRGSLVEFHGPVFVTLDWEVMDREGHGLPGEGRYVVYTPSGEVLRGARAKSLDFSPIDGK